MRARGLLSLLYLALPLALALALGLSGCTPSADECRDPSRDEPCEKLSNYGFFQGALSALQPADGVIPYAPNTPLFSDYAAKDRFLYLPPGTHAMYADPEPLALPVGAIAIKTFSYPFDMRNPALGRRIVETRLLINQPAGLVAYPYVWNDDQTEATLSRIGATVNVSWVHSDGSMRSDAYVVPNTNMCADCHKSDETTMRLIGIKARQLNGDYPYASGSENQLAYWQRMGLLTAVPEGAPLPRLPVWNDPATGTLEERARAWLDVNCGHCHNGTGMASNTGLDLRYEQTSPGKLGMCRSPVAAGKGTGGRLYDVVPGQPDSSILVFRIESTMPKVMMPEQGRKLAFAEGIALVRQWIQNMPGSCP
jgi:uncharacterized repeat protein (TIGR03806 family)